MKVTLKTNTEKYDLNKNPIIKIELPEQVENININNTITCFAVIRANVIYFSSIVIYNI